MAIRFVERGPAREANTEQASPREASQPDVIGRAAAVRRPARSSKMAAAPVDDVALPSAETIDPTCREAAVAPTEPEAVADGLLPGLIEPARPRRRRRGRMMGFG